MDDGSKIVTEGSQLEEITNAVGLGLFASDVVMALGRTVQNGAVGDDDKPVLERGLKLLEALSEEPGGDAAPQPGPRQLGLGGSGLDVLTAIEAEAADTDVNDFLQPLIAALRESLRPTGNPAEYASHLEALRRVFMAIGDVEVARVSNLTHPGPADLPSWRTSLATFNS